MDRKGGTAIPSSGLHGTALQITDVPGKRLVEEHGDVSSLLGRPLDVIPQEWAEIGMGTVFDDTLGLFPGIATP